MSKDYIKFKTPIGKYYRAVLPDGRWSRRIFKTATQAETYSQAWKERYRRLKLAAAEAKEFEASHQEDFDVETDEDQFDGSPDPVEQAELDADDEEDECTWEDEE